MALKEFKIGEVFQCGLVKLRVEKAKSGCCGCIFSRDNDFNDCSHTALGYCGAYYRKDKTDVIFVKED